MSRVRQGSPAAHGAIWDGKDTNFTLFPAHATKIEVCLFDLVGLTAAIAIAATTLATLRLTATSNELHRDGLYPRPIAE
jgi:pullulanase/glycogen debranching enzyme